MRKLKIFLDIDDVLCKTIDEFLNQFNLRYGTSFTKDKITWGLKELSSPTRSMDLIWNEFYLFLRDPSIISRLETYPDSVEVVKKLMGEHAVYFVTSRSLEPQCVNFTVEDKRNIRSTTVNFLRKRGIYNGNVIFDFNKHNVVKSFKADVFMDNAEHHVVDVVNTADDVLCFIFDQTTDKVIHLKKEYPNGNRVMRAHSWRDFFEKLKFLKLIF